MKKVNSVWIAFTVGWILAAIYLGIAGDPAWRVWVAISMGSIFGGVTNIFYKQS